jgi:hypothetical protein
MSAPTTALLFVIVGRNEPLYEAEVNPRITATDAAVTRQNYFVLHSALDLVDKAAWTTSNMYLKVVDKVRRGMAWHVKCQTLPGVGIISSVEYICVYICLQVNHQQVSTFLTAGNIKFMLLHNGKADDAIKYFFQDVYELYVKVSDLRCEECTIPHRLYMLIGASSNIITCMESFLQMIARELVGYCYTDHLTPLYLGSCFQFSMNPFYRYDTPIQSAAFDTRVRAIARRYLL